MVFIICAHQSIYLQVDRRITFARRAALLGARSNHVSAISVAFGSLAIPRYGILISLAI